MNTCSKRRGPNPFPIVDFISFCIKNSISNLTALLKSSFENLKEKSRTPSLLSSSN